MDRLSAMELFVAAIDEGSLSGGARRLGRPPAAATRAVDLLEREAGEPLLVRSTRRIGLTAAGERWLDIWRNVLEQLAAGRAGPGAGGVIVLTAPDQFGRAWVQPVLEDFLLSRPAVGASLLLLSRVVDLLEEGVDLAIRVGPLAGSGLTATRLGQARNLLCAAPSYLERRGAPSEPADVVEHDCIGSAGERTEAWRFSQGTRQRTQTVTAPTRLTFNSGGAALDAILRGRGVGFVMSCMALEHIRAGRLVPVLPAEAPAPFAVHMVFRGRSPRAGAVRDFADHAIPRLRQSLAEIDQAIQAIAPA